MQAHTCLSNHTKYYFLLWFYLTAPVHTFAVAGRFDVSLLSHFSPHARPKGKGPPPSRGDHWQPVKAHSPPFSVICPLPISFAIRHFLNVTAAHHHLHLEGRFQF